MWTKDDSPFAMAEVGDYIDKLVHPIGEIRERTISTLLQKVEFGLMSIDRLTQHPDVLSNLLRLLDLGPHTLRKQLLKLLQYILQEDSSQRRFATLGGIEYLQSFKLVAPLDLVPEINHILEKLQCSSAARNNTDTAYPSEPKEDDRQVTVCFDAISKSVLTESQSDIAEPICDYIQEGDSGIDDSCACEGREQDHTVVVREEPIKFSTFPWQALTTIDRRVLESTAQSLLNHDEAIVIASLHFLDTVVLKDFPVEVLLQRPAVVQALYGCVEEEGETAWRVQYPACACLLTLTQLLSDRLAQFTDPHLSPRGHQSVTPTSSRIATPSTDITRGSCSSSDCNLINSDTNLYGAGLDVRHLGDGQDKSGSIGVLANGLSGTSVHEDDDGDEFILLGMHQMTVCMHCSYVLRVACPLLVAKRPSLQSISLRLLLECLNLLQQCVNPRALWECEEEEDIIEVTGAIKRAIKNFSKMLIRNYEVKKSFEASKYKLTDFLMINQCVALLLCKILKMFVPLEAFKLIIDQEVSASLILVLCDGGFFLRHRTQHGFLFEYFNHVLPDLAAHIKCVLYAANALESTARFLQTSSSQLEKFIKLAREALAVASIHQSSVFVEKLIRGMAKQISLKNADEDNAEKMRHMLLQILHFPDVTIRLAGYTSVKRLVEDSVGICQATDTLLSRSPRILMILTSHVISCLIYSGLTDDSSKVVTIAEDILLGLMKGKLLMNASVWSTAVECWNDSLLHLSCLADSTTDIGRAVKSLVVDLYNKGCLNNLKVLKFNFLCLFALDRQIRIQALSEVLQRLSFSATRFIPDPRDVKTQLHHDIFLVRQPVQLLLSGNLASERGRLLKVVELIQDAGVENAVRKAAWSQLAFLLEDPQLHKPFLKIFSLEYLVINFIGMLKQDGSMNVTLEFVPGALDALRLLATHSSQIRLTLGRDEDFLLCLVRAAFLYYADERTRNQASCLVALLLLDDVLIFQNDRALGNKVAIGGKNFVSAPELLVSKIHIPFIRDTYAWYDGGGLNQEIRTVHQVVQEEDWEVMVFLKYVWHNSCQGSIENDSNKSNTLSSFSPSLKLNEDEKSSLKLSSLRLILEELLINVENGTSHQDVKRNLGSIGLHVLQCQLTSFEYRDLFTFPQWNQSLRRFVTCQPNSSVDEQLLTHVLNLICVVLPNLEEKDSEYFPILKLLIEELARMDTALHHVLKKTGAVNWVASDPNPRALLSVRLFRSVTNLISHITWIVQRFDSTTSFCNIELCDNFALCIASSLLPVLKPNNQHEPQYYNLVVLGCALECLAHVTAIGWPGDEMASQLVACLTRIIKTFHEGRGRAHNSYMGRMVTLSSSLALIHLLSHPKGDLIEDVSNLCNREGFSDWSWLVSMWVYRDPIVTTIGLNVASSLTSRPEGTYLLHDSLCQVSGGVWGAALSYLLALGRSCLVRTSAAELLVKLTENKPSDDEPWTSPVVADTLTGESVEGVEALMILLQHCNFYSTMKMSLSKLWIYPESPDANLHEDICAEWDFSISHLSSFCSPDVEESSNEQNYSGDFDNNKSSSLISVQLYETLLRFLCNVLLLEPKQVIQQVSAHGITQMIIKQLRYLVPLMKTSDTCFQAVETALIFLCTILKYDSAQAPSLACNTSLVHLTMAVLASGLEEVNLKVTCLELMNGLVQGGRWGSSQIIEWIIASPALTIRPVVYCLHSSSPLELQTATMAFIISLLHTVFNDEISKKEGLESILSEVLDTPVKLLSDQDICPGWELGRHLIQLLCHTSDIQNITNGPAVLEKELSSKEKDHQIRILECLKQILLISLSAKKAAHHFHLFFLPVLTKPLSELRESLQTLNIHITAHLMNKKVLRPVIFDVIQNLELATNWASFRGEWVESLSESIIPLLHPLWIPALRTPSLLTGILKFLLAVSAQHQACLYLNRTSGLPGVLLSASRTSRPLLACITTSVCQQLSRLTNNNRGSPLIFKELSKDNFVFSISILINCSRMQECSLVMSKLDITSSVMKWLNCKVAFEEGMTITEYAVKLLAVLTSHNDQQISVCKFSSWLNTFIELLQQKYLQEDTLVIISNLSCNHHAARSFLGSDDFMKRTIEMIGGQESEAVMKLALIIVWALIANNKRGQAILKQYPLQPTLKYLVQIQDKQASLCQEILDILNK